jgi:hypothetical protein
MSPTRPLPVEPLRSSDRCDSCTARALVRANRGSGVLLLCGHHAQQYGDQLRAEGWELERPPLIGRE